MFYQPGNVTGLAHGWQHHIGKNWHNRAPASGEYTITHEDGRVINVLHWWTKEQIFINHCFDVVMLADLIRLNHLSNRPVPMFALRSMRYVIYSLGIGPLWEAASHSAHQNFPDFYATHKVLGMPSGARYWNLCWASLIQPHIHHMYDNLAFSFTILTSPLRNMLSPHFPTKTS
jgi:hypothetical protein